jgi:hypothetical protein
MLFFGVENEHQIESVYTQPKRNMQATESASTEKPAAQNALLTAALVLAGGVVVCGGLAVGAYFGAGLSTDPGSALAIENGKFALRTGNGLVVDGGAVALAPDLLPVSTEPVYELLTSSGMFEDGFGLGTTFTATRGTFDPTAGRMWICINFRVVTTSTNPTISFFHFKIDDVLPTGYILTGATGAGITCMATATNINLFSDRDTYCKMTAVAHPDGYYVCRVVSTAGEHEVGTAFVGTMIGVIKLEVKK